MNQLNKPDIKKIMDSEMSRKQFIVIVFSIVGSLFGLSTIIGLLTKSQTEEPSKRPGYGMQSYGP